MAQPLLVSVTDQLRVLIADGQGLVRAGIRSLLESQGAIRVAAEAADFDDAIAAVRDVRPDVVVMDAELPGGGGVEATRRILAGAGDAAPGVVLVIRSPTDGTLFSALRAGATGMVLKDGDADDLVEAVRAVAAGDALLAPSLARTLVADFVSRPEPLRSAPEQLDELTPREREVMALVAGGLSNEEIAQRLVVTRATAKTHVSRALGKLRARDRAQLVVLAYESGLVSPWRAAGRPLAA